jgi:hypothetical protein
MLSALFLFFLRSGHQAEGAYPHQTRNIRRLSSFIEIFSSSNARFAVCKTALGVRSVTHNVRKTR